jgi:hypothetical protein
VKIVTTKGEFAVSCLPGLCANEGTALSFYGKALNKGEFFGFCGKKLKLKKSNPTFFGNLNVSELYNRIENSEIYGIEIIAHKNTPK